MRPLTFGSIITGNHCLSIGSLESLQDWNKRSVQGENLRKDLSSQLLNRQETLEPFACVCCFWRMQKTIERYHNYRRVQMDGPHMEEFMQQIRSEAETMIKQIQLLEVRQQKLLGQGLGSCSVEELREIDRQLQQSLRSIRARKAKLFEEQVQQLRAKEHVLLEENARLRAKFGGGDEEEAAGDSSKQHRIGGSSSSGGESRASLEVETQLFIGLRPTR